MKQVFLTMGTVLLFLLSLHTVLHANPCTALSMLDVSSKRDSVGLSADSTNVSTDCDCEDKIHFDRTNFTKTVNEICLRNSRSLRAMKQIIYAADNEKDSCYETKSYKSYQYLSKMKAHLQASLTKTKQLFSLVRTIYGKCNECELTADDIEVLASRNLRLFRETTIYNSILDWAHSRSIRRVSLFWKKAPQAILKRVTVLRTGYVSSAKFSLKWRASLSATSSVKAMSELIEATHNNVSIINRARKDLLTLRIKPKDKYELKFPYKGFRTSVLSRVSTIATALITLKGYCNELSARYQVFGKCPKDELSEYLKCNVSRIRMKMVRLATWAAKRKVSCSRFGSKRSFNILTRSDFYKLHLIDTNSLCSIS